jgi:hypothetical protein
MKAHCAHCGEIEELDEVSRLVATIFSMIKLEEGSILLRPCQGNKAPKNTESIFQEIFAGASSHDLLDVFLILGELSRTKYEPVVALDEVIKEVVRKQDVEASRKSGTPLNFNFGWFGR